ncbi:hypothetical protein ACFUN8_07245 [Streptomyces sp. NPDC057307]|uniref:hypothetical protein n=1 Tax=Streptomyces sp. NPDC057307 TaxID=3346096 RepID=UPI00363F56CC
MRETPAPASALPPAPAVPPASPVGIRVGDTVHDPARDRVGVVMARQGPYYQLRPLGGGREWDADPARVRPLTPAELLSARVADANTRSRTALGDVPGR